MLRVHLAHQRRFGHLGCTGQCPNIDALGFLGHGASLTSAIYNGSLAVYFTLTIEFSWKDYKLRKHRIELILHVVPILVGWSTAIASLLLELNNPIGWTCWIGRYPPNCGLPAPWSPPCTRSSIHEVDVYRWALFHAELWFVFVLCAVAMLAMYLKVRHRERAMERYNFQDASSNSALNSMGAISSPPPKRSLRRMNLSFPGGMSGEEVKLSRKVATQAFLYCFFFFTTWIFPMVQFVVANQTGDLLFPLLVLTTIFSPLQGFLDAIIYLRPRYLQYRARSLRRRPQAPSRIESVYHAIMSNEDDDIEGETMPDVLTVPESTCNEQHPRQHENGTKAEITDSPITTKQ